MIRLPENPASEFVDDACVLNPYGSALLVLAHNRENDPVTIHRLGYRSPVIYFLALGLSPAKLELLTLFLPRLAKLDPMTNPSHLENPRD